MQALTIRQPWATLCALGHKRYEWRVWATKYRGPFAIHAAKYISPAMKAACAKQPYKRLLAAAGYQSWEDLPRMAFVGAGWLTNVWKYNDWRAQVDWAAFKATPDYAFRDNPHTKVERDILRMWELEHVVRLVEPIPFVGREGIWAVPHEAMALINDRLPGHENSCRLSVFLPNLRQTLTQPPPACGIFADDRVPNSYSGGQTPMGQGSGKTATSTQFDADTLAHEFIDVLNGRCQANPIMVEATQLVGLEGGGDVAGQQYRIVNIDRSGWCQLDSVGETVGQAQRINLQSNLEYLLPKFYGQTMLGNFQGQPET